MKCSALEAFRLTLISTILIPVFAQGAELWSEDFSGQEGKGMYGDSSVGIITNMDGITSWSVSGASDLDEDATRSWWMVTNGIFEGQDVGSAIGYWESTAIDVSGYDTVQVKMDFLKLADGCTTASEYFEVNYKLDGGSRVNLLTIGTNNQDSLNGTTWTSLAINVSAATDLNIENRIKINGGNDGWSFDNVILQTGPSNQPPVLTPIGNKSTAIGVALNFDVVATETINDDLINLFASNLPPGAVFNVSSNLAAITNTFTWASPNPPGVYTTTFYAVDNDGGDNETIEITVAGYARGPDSVWINEIHYEDDQSPDSGEGIEVAGRAGTGLGEYWLYLYNGFNGETYSPVTNLWGTVDNEQKGFGARWFGYGAGNIQNGSPDAVALVHVKGGVTSVHQFISYGGVIVAADGPAIGLASKDIGVAESSSTTTNESLQLTGRGYMYEQFTWVGPTNASKGTLNNGQVIITPGGVLIIR